MRPLHFNFPYTLHVLSLACVSLLHQMEHQIAEVICDLKQHTVHSPDRETDFIEMFDSFTEQCF